MIIDMHRHMWSAQERHRRAFERVPGLEVPPEADFDWEQRTEEIVCEMKDARVDKTVLLVADFVARLGEAPFDIDTENELIVKARERHPDRVIAFFGIDPRRPGAADRYEKAVKEWKVSGLKLHPTVGYFPHDRACYPMYELSTFYGVPVLFHSGPGFHPLLYSRFTHPLEYDQVATDFPLLKIIMGHAGEEWWQDCITVARNHPNMVLELSEWQVTLRDEPEEAVKAIHKMRNALGMESIVWGSDFPGIGSKISFKESVEMFRRLPALGKEYGLTFTEREVEAVLGENAKGLIRLA